MKQKAKIKMIKKNPCAYCDRAQNFFNAKGLEVEIIDLTDTPEEIIKWKQKTGWLTVPIILINDELVGGYQDIKALDADGLFDKMVFE